MTPMIGAIQTFGDLIHWHPHLHALVSEGVFLQDGTFMPLPKLATEPFLKLWVQEVFKLLLAEGKITEEDRGQYPQLAALRVQRGSKRPRGRQRHGGPATVDPVFPALSVQPGADD